MSRLPRADNTAKIREIKLKHLEHLASHDLITDPPGKTQVQEQPHATFEDLKQWTNDNLGHIKNALNTGVSGGGSYNPTIDWECAFVAFMESAAVYLRDDGKVIEAAQAHRLGKEVEALQLLEESTAKIRELANMWEMEFVVLCDFLDYHPLHQKWMVGPFCGAFYPQDQFALFAGIAFKGTSKTSEWVNDFFSTFTVQAPEGTLWGTKVGQGAYYPLFSPFLPGYPTAFGYIREKIKELYATRGQLITANNHFTGHGLGGAYATLCYAQLVSEHMSGGFPTTNLQGDLYTFGSPRVGLNDFAKNLRDHRMRGSPWRIVNYKDPVATLPISNGILPWFGDKFIHIDEGQVIHNNAPPEPIPSEIDGNPPIPVQLLPFEAHDTREYYKSLLFTMTGRIPASDTASRQLEFLRVINNLGGVSGFRGHLDALAHSSQAAVDPTAFAHSLKCEITLDTVELCTLGRIRAGSFVGKLTAWGDATALAPIGVTLYLDAWDRLTRSNNKWTIVRASPTELQIQFTVESTIVAVAVVTPSSTVEEAPRLSGTCAWSFDDEELSKVVSKSVEKLYEEALVYNFKGSAAISVGAASV